jgi:glycosyltransferase involved in cell wall biosynthesis
MPVYNNATTIAQAIESVLGQTFADFEVILIDDCSSDRTMDVASSYHDRRIRLSRNDHNLGAVANWNRTLGDARGRYIKVLCGDDFLYPECLESQVATLDRHESDGVLLASCRRDIVYEDGAVAIRSRGLKNLSGVVTGSVAVRRAVRSGTNPFGEPAAVLVRADAVTRSGPFATASSYVVDLEMWCRILEHGNLYAARETLCAFRIGHASWSRRLAKQQSAQMAELYTEIRARQPRLVTAGDAWLGRLRSRGLMAGRRLAYVVNTTRGARDRSTAGPAVVISTPPPR